jgi:type I restriction enzyme S subunit
MVVRSGILKHSIPTAINTESVSLNQDMKAFRFLKSMLPEFFLYWIDGQQKQLLQDWVQVGATVENINTRVMLNSEISVPDLPTQRTIADFLDCETTRIDHIREKTRVSIDRLREYRSSLITAAVTGQIDVSKWVKAGNAERRLDAAQATVSV